MQESRPTSDIRSPRRCRVALLPDCHVQFDHESLPTRPARRLYGAARLLMESCLVRLASMKVDAVLLLGDTLDPADQAGLRWLRSLIGRSPIPIHTIIGNHEAYGWVSVEQFHRELGLPPHGHHLALVNDVPFIMLATPDQDSLNRGTFGYRWLRETLSRFDTGTNVFCCAHFSLLLHPCVQGHKNDGMQVLWGAPEVLDLLASYPSARAWIAGHKNVPSKLVHNGILHLLSPQLIQAPCAFRLIDIHADGIRSRTYDIEQQELAQLSQRAYGAGYRERLGRSEDRDFWWSWNDGT